MLERCDCCGAYLEDGGLACEECRKDMKNRINHRNQRNDYDAMVWGMVGAAAQGESGSAVEPGTG